MQLLLSGIRELKAFQADLGIQIRFGEGALDQLGEIARGLGAKRALIVTDPGLLSTGAVETAQRSLNRASLSSALFSDIEENPTSDHVVRGCAVALQEQPDILVGLGGGSAMDCAKGINFLLTNGGDMEDYWGFGKAERPMLASIGVPTTTGTGSEAQSYALISRASDHRKMACGDSKARFRAVLLDPVLTDSLPPRVLATSAIDACSHALESYVCNRWTPLSRMFSRHAWQLLESGFEGALESGSRAARGRLLLGAHLAGWAIESSMLGAAHACANPLTAHFGVVHGMAVGLMLPHVIRFNRPVAEADYDELLGGRRSGGGRAAETLADWVAGLRAQSALPRTLRELGVPETDLEMLASEAASEWTGGFNPRPLSPNDCLELYRKAF